MRRHPNVVNIDEVEAKGAPKPGPAPFGGTGRRLAVAAGSKKLGASLYEVPAGQIGFPCHAHHINEEALYLLQGKGTLRIGPDRVAVRAGDWIALPAGEATAHQLIADQGEALTYLAVSTMLDADIVTYPDSGKLMVAVGYPASTLRKVFHTADGNVDYWEGEGERSDKG